MVLKADQDRIRTLLKDTITLLCRNGLSFQTEFSVEALIGITLDKDDVFLVSMKELVRSENAGTKTECNVERSQSEDEGDSSPSFQLNSDLRKHKRRRRKLRVKQELDTDNVRDERSCSDDGGDQSNFDSASNDEPPCKKSNDTIPFEKVDRLDREDTSKDGTSGDDVTFIKQEMDDRWTQEQSGEFDNFADSLQDPSNLVPVGSQESSALWEQTLMPTSSHMFQPRILPAQTLSSEHGETMEPSGPGNDSAEQQVSGHEGNNLHYDATSSNEHQMHSVRTFKPRRQIVNRQFRYHCGICGKGFMGNAHLDGHMVEHTGVKPFKCPFCDKSYRYKFHMKEHIETRHYQQFVQYRLDIRENYTKLISS